MLFFKTSNACYTLNDNQSIKQQLKSIAREGSLTCSFGKGEIRYSTYFLDIQDSDLLDLLDLTYNRQENDDDQWTALENYLRWYYDMWQEEFLDEDGYMNIDDYLREAARLDPRIDWIWIG